MATPNLNEIHDTLIDLAFKAGEIINNALPDTGPDSKKNTSTAKKPTPQQLPLTTAPTFIIDPIDGTINFIHNFPHACVSLGFAINKIPTVGVVYNPSTQTLYSAIKGQGAFKNRTTRLPLSGPTPAPLTGLSNALVAIEWGSDRGGANWGVKTRTFERLGADKSQGGAMVRSFRSLGSAALNICAVAEGVVDVYWEGGCWEWDVCAGWVILGEAGGVIVDGNPGGWEVAVDGRRYLAVRGAEKGQREIVEEFWSYIQGRLTYGN
ncbi:hypothetical protein N7533_000470 [Penicillium manginii]|uniref:uncharacterized protein n=1 Tax=Penicillium manginii TaxID=203109 RepID=UPI002548E634|nr:uncharacterized protein N7533_000470 [Penicillium manginii]KAJ5767887.1 hypothetical protein N7533_000470 [Penicillium manginii]